MAGSQKIAADGVVGTSGKKILVYDFVVRSGAGGAAAVAVYDGTGTGGTLMLNLATSGASTNSITSFLGGMYFGSGCYLDIDTNTSYVIVNYEQLNS